MSQLLGSQLYLDKFYGAQAAFGTAVTNPDGSFTFSSTGSAAPFGNTFQVLGYGDSSQPEAIVAYVSGGVYDGQEPGANIVANTGSSFLLNNPQAADFGIPQYLYVANSPSSLPAVGQSVTVNPLSPSNTYTFVPYAPACFASGTRIRTAQGEVAVEDLAVGDEVILASGEREAIVWIGHRRTDCARHPDPRLVRPVRVTAGAFGPGLPARDLWLSPDHAVFAEGVLIPVKALVNGTTIAQMTLAEVTYWHVELASHDVLLAEGIACESYLDTANRDAFENGGEVVALNPDFWSVTADARRCAPLCVDGPEVERVRFLIRNEAAPARNAA